MFLQSKVNIARYIAQVVNPVILPFIRLEGDVLFQQDNARPHTAAVTQRALRGVQQLPWPARSLDPSPIEHVWDMMKRELTLSPEPAATIAELRQRLGIVSRLMALAFFMTVYMREYILRCRQRWANCILM